jgi:hypothetical protein
MKETVIDSTYCIKKQFYAQEIFSLHWYDQHIPSKHSSWETTQTGIILYKSSWEKHFSVDFQLNLIYSCYFLVGCTVKQACHICSKLTEGIHKSSLLVYRQQRILIQNYICYKWLDSRERYSFYRQKKIH